MEFLVFMDFWFVNAATRIHHPSHGLRTVSIALKPRVPHIRRPTGKSKPVSVVCALLCSGEGSNL